MPIRVRLAEQMKAKGVSLTELAERTAEAGMALVLIHPSYAATVPHECVLTRFAADRSLDVLEVHDLLHPDRGGGLFLDTMHPSPPGHRAIAEALAAPLVDEVLPALDRRGSRDKRAERNR